MHFLTFFIAQIGSDSIQYTRTTNGKDKEIEHSFLKIWRYFKSENNFIANKKFTFKFCTEYD